MHTARMKNILLSMGIDSLPFFLAILSTFFLAGWIKGVIGLGLPTVAVGLLGLMMTPTEAAAILIVPSFVTNAWQLAAGPAFRPLLQRLKSMLIGIVFGTLIGGYLLGGGGISVYATMALGIALVLYAVAGLASLQVKISPAAERYLSPAIGGFSGLIAAMTGVFVIPAVPYLQMLRLEKDDLMQAMGLSFTVSTIALAVALGQSGALHAANAGISLLALLPALAGMFAGQWMRSKIRPAVFRKCFFAGLIALGSDLVLQAL
jgi:uncharacterized membrane protein YfcA